MLKKKWMVSVSMAMLPFIVSAAETHPPLSATMQKYEAANQAGDDSTALNLLLEAASDKDPEGLTRLGEAYLHARYGELDEQRAFSYFQMAANVNSPRGMTNLGIMYLNGVATAKDVKTARAWFEKASAAGDMKAPRYLGLIEENGWGVPVNYTKAVKFYQMAADKGDISSQYYLGQLYEKGKGIKKDEQQAVALYLKSAARGDEIALPAILALGNVYEQGIGVTKDVSQALSWYKKAAGLGSELAREKVSAIQFPNHPELMNMTAIVKVMGDGQKVSAVALEYAKTVDPKSLDVRDYQVPNREVTRIYTNELPEVSTTSNAGRFVIIELKTVVDNKNAEMGGGPDQPTTGANTSTKSEPPAGGGGPQLGQVSDKPAKVAPLAVSLLQTGEIKVGDNQTISPSAEALTSNLSQSPDTQDFQQMVFYDEQYRKSLMFNLYIPKHYDPKKKYPLVLFMHDAGAVSNNPIETLTQGTGAVVWASPEEQAKHESFVLAPQFNTVIAGDASKTTDDMDIAVNLLKSLLKTYSIDESRLYNTGQSMGGMTSIAMNIKYPDLFAASYLVACQWEPTLTAVMTKKPMWIVVSEGDTKAKPGMDAITTVLKNNGATIAKANWSAEGDANYLASQVEAMRQQGKSINFTTFNGGNHRYTWFYAYSIPGIRDWLFEQHK